MVFGSAAEQELCEPVAQQCDGMNLAGATTLREFIDMTAACDVFLTNDSGAMHIASALGVPSVTVFGPTDEIGTGPGGVNARLYGSRWSAPRANCGNVPSITAA